MSETQDLRTISKTTTASPKEAASNIENSKFYDVSPDTYAQNKTELDKDINAVKRVPSEIGEDTAEYLKQDTQRFELAQNDITKLDDIESKLKSYKTRIFDIPEARRKSNELWNKDITDGKISDADLEEREDLDAHLEEMNRKNTDQDDKFENFMVEAFSGAGDILRTYTSNKTLIAGTMASGAAIGGGRGFLTPLPGGVFGGAMVGAGTGFVTGATMVSFLDGYKQSRAEVYKELSGSVDKEGNPLNLSRDIKTRTALGVGMVSGIVSGVAGKVLARANPMLKRFTTGREAAKLLIESPAVMARMNILGGVIKSMIAEGGEESVQEIAQIVGVELAKVDDTEGSFINALDNIMSTDTLKRASYAGAVGATTGGIFAGSQASLGYKGLKKRFTKAQDIAKKKHAVMSKQNQILETVAVVNSTEMNEASPAEMDNFISKIYAKVKDKAQIDQDLYMHIEDVQDFAGTPEGMKEIMDIIDPTGELAKVSKELNVPLQVQEQDLIKIAKEHPEITDHLRVSPEGESPAEIRTAAQEQVDAIDQAESKRQELFDKLGVTEGELSPEMQAEVDTILTNEISESEVANEAEFFEEGLDKLVEPVEGIVSKEESDKINKTVLDARMNLAKVLNAETDKKFKALEDKIFKSKFTNNRNEVLKTQNENLSVVDNFKKIGETSEAALNLTSKHKRKNFSSVAIDPESLTPELKQLYLDVPEMKKIMTSRKVFVNGGLNVDESAALLGIDSGEKLLQILAETPTRKQILNASQEIQLKVREDTQQLLKRSHDTARDKAFTDVTKTLRQQMKIIASKSYGTIKRGVIKISGRIPRVEGLNRKAKQLISKSKVREVNPKKYEVAGKTSQRASLKAWTDTQFEQAYKQLEAAALNNEMQKEAMNTKDQITRSEKFWKMINSSKSAKKTLKASGLDKVMSEYTDVFNMSKNNRGQKELDNFNTFLVDQVKDGNYTPSVPDRLSDTRMNYQDMTSEQYLAITDMGKFIYNQAKLKNNLLKKNNARKDLASAEMISEAIENDLRNNPNYDPAKAKRSKSRYENVTEWFGSSFNSGMSMIATIKTSVMELDQHKTGGLFQDLIGNPIKQARDLKRNEMGLIEKHDRAIINKYGMKKFQDMFNEFIIVPEFLGREDLGKGNGKIRKIDLLTLLAYTGDPEGRKAIENFQNESNEKLSYDDVQTVLDRELTSADAKLVQDLMVDRFKGFTERSAALHKRTTGIEPTMVKGVGFTHNGKDYEGGYYPIKRTMLSDNQNIMKYLGKISEEFSNVIGENDSHFFAKMRSAEMTDQGRFKHRTDSGRALDLRFENIFDFTEEVIHDLNFRETGIDVLKILKDPTNIQNIKSVIGDKKFVNLLNNTKDMISKTTEDQATIFSEENAKVNSFINNVHSVHAVKTIGYNVTSALIQPDALLNLGLRAGPRSLYYVATTAKKLMSDPILYNKYRDIAAQINPDIQFEKDGIDNAVIKDRYDFIPGTPAFFESNDTKSAQSISKIRMLQKKAIDQSFFMIREGDQINRVIATLALTEQFLAGHIEGWSIDKVNALSEKDKATKLSSVVRQVIDLSLTASAPEDKTPLEKLPVVKLGLRYWTDRRSRLNSMVGQLQKTKSHFKEGEYAKASGDLMMLGLVSGASLAFMDMARNGTEELWKKFKKADDLEDIAELTAEGVGFLAYSPVEQFLQTTPVIDNINYAADLDIRSDYRNVSVPFFGVMNELAMSKNALREALHDIRKLKFPSVSEANKKAAVTSLGYISGGAPTNAMFKLAKAIESREFKKAGRFLKDVNRDLKDEINLFINTFEDNEEAEEFINELEQYKEDNLAPDPENPEEIIPENTKEVIKAGNTWNTYNAETDEGGLYQFTSERWNEIAEAQPDLGITEGGRLSKDTSEQETAVKWSNENNTRGLTLYEVPVNHETLYGSHKFGIDNYVKIHASLASDSLTKVLGEDYMNDPVLKPFKTVKSVKQYIRSQVKQADNIDNAQ